MSGKTIADPKSVRLTEVTLVSRGPRRVHLGTLNTADHLQNTVGVTGDLVNPFRWQSKVTSISEI